MKIKALVGLAVAFAILTILGFLTISWSATIPKPNATEDPQAAAAYQDMTNTTEVTMEASNGVTLMLVAGLFIAGIIIFVGLIMKKVF